VSAADWPSVRLGDCVVTNDEAYSPKEAWEYVSYLDTGNITENRIAEIQHFDAATDKLPSRARRKVQPGDIVYSTVRPNQRHFGIIKDPPDNFLASTGFAVMRGKPDIADTNFLYWYLSQDHIVEQLHTIAEHSTSAYPSIRPADIERLELRLPPLGEQRRIAGVLGALDDKIELNRRMAQTLEQVARALFRSWFVDFEPVRAKQAQRWSPGQSLPGLPAQLRPLFPDQLEPSPQGPIPQGWRVATLGDVVETVRGRSYKSAELSESDTALVTLKSFARGGGYREDGLKPYTGPHKPEQVVEPGEVVLACTDVTQAAEVVGRPAIVQPAPEYRRLVASLDTLIVRPREEAEMPRAFLYLLLGTPAFTAHALAHTSGTTVLHLAKAAVPNFQFALPPADLLEAFARQAQPALDRASHTHDEIPTIAAQRDRLLTTLLTAS